MSAATLGGVLSGPTPATVNPAGPTRTIIVLEGLLHTDILLPADPDVRARFAFLRHGPVPLDHPNLRWLSVGWGSRAFYTTAGTYADIEPGAVWRAVTGDTAVMRVVGLPEIDQRGLRSVVLSAEGFERLLDHVDASFVADPGGRPFAVDASLAPNDAFYVATGRFSLLNPCNEWTRRALLSAGVPAGRWTPTTHSLALALDRYAGAVSGGNQP